MNLEIDQNVLALFSGDIKVFFYQSGCEGTKINLEDYNWDKDLLSFSYQNKNIYYQIQDEQYLNGWKIFLQKKNENSHSKNEKFLFVSPQVKSRCWCSSSFSFENTLIKKDKLKQLQSIFKNK